MSLEFSEKLGFGLSKERRRGRWTWSENRTGYVMQNEKVQRSSSESFDTGYSF